MSPDVFEAYLTYTGTEYTPSMNEGVLAGLRNVNFIGMTLIEANILGQDEVKFYDYTGMDGLDYDFKNVKSIESEDTLGKALQETFGSFIKLD